MRRAGLVDVAWSSRTLGLVTIHVGTRIGSEDGSLRVAAGQPCEGLIQRVPSISAPVIFDESTCREAHACSSFIASHARTGTNSARPGLAGAGHRAERLIDDRLALD